MSKNIHPSSRDRLLNAAEQLLREVGMAGVGIKEVVAHSGAPIGSVYHYFPGGKTQLVSESLRNHADKSRRLFANFFDGKKTAAAALRALFNTAAEGFERAGGNKGCALGAVTLDLTEEDPGIRELCKRTFDDWATLIASQLPWPDGRLRRSFAETVIAALEGAFILGKAGRSGDPFRHAGKWLAAMASSCDSGPVRRPFRKSKPRRRP